MEIGVVADFLRPTPHEIGPFLPVEHEWIRIDTTARRLEMDEDRIRRPQIGPAAFGYPQAEIHVVEIDREVLGVEPTDRLEFVSLDGDAGRRHRTDLMGRGEPV